MAEKKTDTDALIDQWFRENFAGVVGMPTEIYNLIQKATGELKQKIKGA